MANSPEQTLQRVSLAAALVVGALALLGLAGWLTGWQVLASVHPDFIPMAPNTAVAFLLLAGTALTSGKWRAVACRAVALLVASIAFVALLPENPANRFDHVFPGAGGTWRSFPIAVMSPITAVSFLLLAGSLALSVAKNAYARALSIRLAAVIALVGIATAAGYLFGTPLFATGTRIIPLALTTGMAFLAFGVHLIASGGPSEWPVRSWIGASVRARLLRVFLPLTLGLVLVEGWLAILIASGTGGNPAAVAVGLAAVSVLVVSVVVTRIAGTIGREIEEADAKQRSLEEQVRQAQKMEAVGQLAGGVAHDFNNLLTVILSFSQFVREDLGEGHPSRTDVGEIHAAAERGARLTRQLLAFSRREVTEPRVIDLDESLREMGVMIRTLIGADIDLAFARSAEKALVNVDLSHVEQIALNLAVNARDAMPTGGKLTFESSCIELDGDHVRGHFGAKPGRYVMLAVTDTGHGMDPETQARIFEPFFTTKAPGKGTGLGLSVVHSIVRQCGGDILVYSAVGKGTTVKVFLPRVEDLPAQRSATRERSFAGTETVLIADDEGPIRAVARRALSKHGYRVLLASDAEEALRISETGRPIDLLITDVVMPGTSGPELARTLLERLPEARLLFTSGYTGGALVRHGVLEAGVAYLPKPFTPEQLVSRVREVLDRKPAPVTARLP